MNVDPGDASLVKDILWQGEQIKGTFKQRRIGPGGSVTVPTSVIVTDNRIIIVNRATLGFRKDYEVIPYAKITSVRLEAGIISSSVFVRVEGYDRDTGLLKNGKEEGEIDGLHNKDARELADFVNAKLGEELPNQQGTYLDSNVGGYVFCSKCGTKNTASSKFCTKCGAKLMD
ncbi:MAG: PH domain-containing protein [Candidatus Micrarchaeota archaeon]|nr:PH domain-containing protein [Candidatus Micrarchaeota archaeon]